MLQNVDLPVPTGSAAAADQPARLWPLNMYPAFGASLTMRDVRLVTSEVSFQQHLIFFQKELGAAWPMYTVRELFCLHSGPYGASCYACVPCSAADAALAHSGCSPYLTCGPFFNSEHDVMLC